MYRMVQKHKQVFLFTSVVQQKSISVKKSHVCLFVTLKRKDRALTSRPIYIPSQGHPRMVMCSLKMFEKDILKPFPNLYWREHEA